MPLTVTNTAKGDNKLYSDAKGVVPNLDLRFASQKNLSDYITGQNLITFSRPVGTNQSPGTYIDENGQMQLSSPNEPRFTHDPATGESLGLLIEESRENILHNSTSLSTQTVSTESGTYSLSFYGTGTVTLSGASTVGPLTGTSDTDRAVLVFTATSNSLTLTVTGNVTYAQLERGSFPTSYIPTLNNKLTRSADVAKIEGSDFSSFYSKSKGTVFAKAIPVSSTESSPLFLFAIANPSGFGTDSIQVSRIPGTSITTAQVTANNQSATYTANLTAGSEFLVAIAYGLNSVNASFNGSTETAFATSNTPEVVSFLDIGASGVTSPSGLWNSTIARLVYFPDRLSDTTLQAITAP